MLDNGIKKQLNANETTLTGSWPLLNHFSNKEKTSRTPKNVNQYARKTSMDTSFDVEDTKSVRRK